VALLLPQLLLVLPLLVLLPLLLALLFLKVGAALTAGVTLGVLTAGAGVVALAPLLIGVASTSAGAGYFKYKVGFICAAIDRTAAAAAKHWSHSSNQQHAASSYEQLAVAQAALLK
jgi:hypothetical protein